MSNADGREMYIVRTQRQKSTELNNEAASRGPGKVWSDCNNCHRVLFQILVQ